MTVSVTTGIFSAAMLTCIPFGTIIWRKVEAKLHEEDQKWRDQQAARLETLKQRINAEADLVNAWCYPDLPSVPLAGLLAPPSNAPLEYR